VTAEAARRLLLGLAVALALADGSIVTLALPDILGQFDVEIPTVAWVLTSYNLVLALAAVPAALLARRRARPVGGVGIVVFALASLACAMAPNFGVLLASRCVQALGAAALVTAALELLAAQEPSDEAAVRTWVRAGILGAALGPALGGVVTQVLGWEWIFALQVPAALVSLAALRSVSVRRAPAPSRERPDILMNAALVLISAALAAALFLLVLLLVNGWRLEPAAAGIVVTVMPLAAILAAPLARRIEGLLVRAAAGAILISGGLAALGLLPRAGWLWTVPPQVLIGVGLGLTLSALTERALRGRASQVLHGGWTIASRHAGVVLGLLLLTPLFTAALDRNQDEALAAGTAAVLDSGIPPLDKLRVAQDVLTEVERAEGRMPDVAPAFEGRDEPAYRSLQAALVDQLDRAATNAFSSSFLLGATLALAALVPVALAVGRR
jgi:MFS family permease